jgi:hypothetical protein
MFELSRHAAQTKATVSPSLDAAISLRSISNHLCLLELCDFSGRYVVCLRTHHELIMIQSASSMSVRDDRTGKLLLSMRFTGLADAIEYLSGARLVCSFCEKHFGARSTITMMNRGDDWELMLPHQCEPAISLTQDLRREPTLSVPLST